ncbi:MAG: hypothetical protein VR72_00375 [Clostridiaceae bacterium BRH_c20a]|nr:MAG: hypothetical protein VR72_00375 [Clostridiaceae bacterium BRH_c20a]
MFKVKDTIIAGILAGWMGNVVKEVLTWSFYLMGWVRYTFVHIAAGFYYSKENIDAPFSLVTGVITDWTIAGTFGVILLYLLRYTGSDYAIFKGIGLGSLVYVITFGIGMALDITRATLITPLPDFLLIMSHLTIGGVSGWALEKHFGNIVSLKLQKTKTREHIVILKPYIFNGAIVPKKPKKIMSVRSQNKKK